MSEDTIQPATDSPPAIQVGDRVAYLGSVDVELGTVVALHPDLEDGDGQAFSVTWDDGFDDEGYWNTTDSNIRRVKRVR